MKLLCGIVLIRLQTSQQMRVGFVCGLDQDCNRISCFFVCFFVAQATNNKTVGCKRIRLKSI